MTEKQEDKKYLKARVYRISKWFVAVFGVVLAWLNLYGFSIPSALSTVPLPAGISSGLTLLVTVAVAALDALPGEQLKAALVFWRWRDPLPGSRAFTKTNLEADHRIAVDRLKLHVGGTFPRRAQEQNSTWYRLYKLVKSEPEVENTHYEYLLFRDLTWFASVLLAASLVSLVVNWQRAHELGAYAGFVFLVGLLFSRAGQERGYRFVRTVLAVVAARPIESEESTTKK